MIASLDSNVKPLALSPSSLHFSWKGTWNNPLTLFKKRRWRRPRCLGLSDICFIGLGGRGEISMDWSSCIVHLYMLTSDLTSLVPQQFSHWLQLRKVGTPRHHRHFKDLNARYCRWRPVTEQWRQKIKNNNNKKIQLNLSTTATLGTEETGHCREVETRVNVWTVRQKMWPLGEVWLYFISSFWFFGENYRNFIRYFLCSRNWEPKTLHFD